MVNVGKIYQVPWNPMYLYRRFANMKDYPYINWVENFFHEPQATHNKKDSKNPTTSGWINWKKHAFDKVYSMCVCVCVGATSSKKLRLPPWFETAETHIREQRWSNPWIFGRARRVNSQALQAFPQRQLPKNHWNIFCQIWKANNTPYYKPWNPGTHREFH